MLAYGSRDNSKHEDDAEKLIQAVNNPEETSDNDDDLYRKIRAGKLSQTSDQTSQQSVDNDGAFNGAQTLRQGDDSAEEFGED